MKVSAADVDNMARTIYGEARGEDRVGQLCVGWVIRNRAEKQYRGDTIAAVCQRPWQFSCWNANDPNRPKLLTVDLSDPAFREAMRNTLQVLESDVDPTNGATHYHTIKKPRGVDVWPPNWAQGVKPCATVGAHVFYKGVA